MIIFIYIYLIHKYLIVCILLGYFHVLTICCICDNYATQISNLKQYSAVVYLLSEYCQLYFMIIFIYIYLIHKYLIVCILLGYFHVLTICCICDNYATQISNLKQYSAVVYLLCEYCQLYFIIVFVLNIFITYISNYVYIIVLLPCIQLTICCFCDNYATQISHLK